MLKDFKAFIMRGNVVDMAIGIVIGAAFGAIVASLVKDIIMPPIGLALSGIDFSSLVVVLKQGNPPVTINYGTFLLTIISFLIIAAVIFFFVVRPMAHAFAPKKAAEAPAPNVKDCPYCYTAIPIKATRCPNCTSELAK
jgi:large conductance mechanosensitive channel